MGGSESVEVEAPWTLHGTAAAAGYFCFGVATSRVTANRVDTLLDVACVASD